MARSTTGTQVIVTVATGNPTVLVPDARLLTEPEFFTLLAQNSLIPGLRSEEFDLEVPIGLITRTNPRAGIEVAQGTAIDYLVSLGPPPTPTPIAGDNANARDNADSDPDAASATDAGAHARRPLPPPTPTPVPTLAANA